MVSLAFRKRYTILIVVETKTTVNLQFLVKGIIPFLLRVQITNNEEETTSNIFVDNTAPEIFVNFSINPIGQKGGKNIYPNYVRMYIGATDKHTGTETLLYSVDGGPFSKYSSPQTLDASEVSKFKKNKKYEVRVVAKDKLGNESEKILEFFVGKAE